MTNPGGGGFDDDIDDDGAPFSAADEPASLALLESGVRVLTERVDEFEDHITDTVEALSSEVDDLRDTVDDLIKKEKQDPPPPAWWASRADGDDWDALAAWVDSLRLSRSLSDKHVIPGCWPAHPGVVEELAALHAAWKLAVITDALSKTTGTVAYISWFDRWLWPCLGRICSADYAMVNCEPREHRPERPSAASPTDRGLFPPGLTRRR